MINKTRRTEINIETHERTIIRFGVKRLSVYCECCKSTANGFTLEQTAGFFDMTLTEVCRAIGAGEFHLVKTKSRLPLVCGKSFGNENKPLMLNGIAKANLNKE